MTTFTELSDFLKLQDFTHLPETVPCAFKIFQEKLLKLHYFQKDTGAIFSTLTAIEPSPTGFQPLSDIRP